MNKSALVIYPNSSQMVCDEIKLTEHLMSMQFLGKPLAGSTFQGGKHFLNYISFIGCSPVVELNHSIDEQHPNAIYIELKFSSEAMFFHRKKYIVPNCPHCEQQIILNQFSIKQPCQFCDAPLDLGQLDWKRRAFFSSSVIFIQGIFENEAIPDSIFLDALQEITHLPWLSMFI